MRLTQYRLLFWFALLSIIVLSWMIHCNLLINDDVSWLIYVSKRLLGGGTYSRDFFELNPPLIFYLYTPILLLEKIFSCTQFTALFIYIFLLSALSLFVCSTFLGKIVRPEDHDLSHILLLTLSLLFLIVPMQDFGQREHLLFILTLPYLLLVTSRLQGHHTQVFYAIGIGLLAALGFGLKPYFLITLAIIELYYMIRKRHLLAWIRPEVLTILAFLIVYVTSVFIFYPDYIHFIIPFDSRFYYHPYQASLRQILLFQPALFSGLAVLFFIIQYKNNPYRILSSILLLGLSGFYISYFIPHIMWHYHVLPAFQMAILLITVLLGILIKQPHTVEHNHLGLTLLAIGSGFFLLLSNMMPELLLTMYPMVFFGYVGSVFTLLFLVWQPHNSIRVLCTVGSIITLAGCFSYLVGLTYIPNINRLFLTLFILLLLFSLCTPAKFKTDDRGIFAATISVLILYYPFYQANYSYQNGVSVKANLHPLSTFMSKYAQHQHVYFFTNPSTYAFPALVAAQAIPVARTEDLGWIPGMLIHHYPQQQQDANFLIEMIAADLVNKKPLYIFVDSRDKKDFIVDKNFDYIRFLSKNDLFRSAWQDYHYLTTIDNMPAYKYQVYKRL